MGLGLAYRNIQENVETRPVPGGCVGVGAVHACSRSDRTANPEPGLKPGAKLAHRQASGLPNSSPCRPSEGLGGP